MKKTTKETYKIGKWRGLHKPRKGFKRISRKKVVKKRCRKLLLDYLIF